MNGLFAKHPFALFWANLFHTTPGIARIESTKQTAVSLTELAAMPRQTQLLLAHFLQHSNRDLMLLEDDTDVCKLLEARWLLSEPAPSVGIICFKVKPDIWRKLRLLSPMFLSAGILNELKAYRMRKSAQYPWIW